MVFLDTCVAIRGGGNYRQMYIKFLCYVRDKILTTIPTFSEVYVLAVSMPTFTGVFLPGKWKWQPETGNDFSFACIARVWMSLVSILMHLSSVK